MEDIDALLADPFLGELARREKDVLDGKLLTIIFIRYEDAKCEKSGYIDLNHRFKTEDFRQYFRKKSLLMPKKTDLSYYNWKTGKCEANDSPNFKVDASKGMQGLCFRNKRDRKVIYVDPVDRKDDESQKRVKVECEAYQ